MKRSSFILCVIFFVSIVVTLGVNQVLAQYPGPSGPPVISCAGDGKCAILNSEGTEVLTVLDGVQVNPDPYR